MTWTLTLRKCHAYLGLLIAPSVIFFALTGALQIFNLHEAHGSYKPAPLIEKLSAVHKDQVFEAHERPPQEQPGPPGAGPGGAPPAHDDDKVASGTLVLKWYFLVVAVALAVSSLLGIWMGATQLRSKGLVWTLLILGTVIPIATFAL